MVDLGSPGEAELSQDELEHLEVVVLLVAHHIDVGIQMVGIETALGGAQVLGDVHGGAVPTKYELAVQPVGREVAPHRTVRVRDKDTFLQALLYQFLAQEVSLRFMVHLVEGDAQGGVGFVKTLVHPAVHHLP